MTTDETTNAFGEWAADKTLHLESVAKADVTKGAQPLKDFLQSGLDAHIPFLDGALGESDEAQAVVSELTGRRNNLNAVMTAQSHTVQDIVALMSTAIDNLTNGDSAR